MPIPISFKELDVLEQIRLFLEAVLPAGTPAVQGQDNRVPEPLQGDYVIMTTMGLAQLAWSKTSYDQSDAASTATITKDSKWKVQLDVHGDSSASNAEIIATLWFSPWGVQFFKGSIIAPLYADEPVQSAFNNGEEQYETRWIVTIYLQAKPVLTMPQDYATTLAIKTYEADQ